MPPTVSRISWGDEDSQKLISLWGKIKSVYIIAIILNRSLSSVQTQASRLGLPPRHDSSFRHRRRWTEENDAFLVEEVRKSEKTGGLDIQAIADELDRSVDAVFFRIESLLPNASDIRKRIYVPSVLHSISLESYVGAGTPTRQHSPSLDGLIKKTDKSVRRCLRCERRFWSEGSHNRICSRCKRSDEWCSD